ncbi:hypothetical protein EG329_008167 [Mollisiaceae sp. DMI_Dod_QoI]|nr:hypothetical protein EG329_008167 [Helotiales sp. DMI_Dod_QoI]
MRFQLTTLLALATATLTVASPTWQAFEDWAKGIEGKQAPDHTSPRHSIFCHPKTPRKPPPCPPPRTKVCYVQSHNDGVTDDSKYIMSALHSCNNGGHVVFREGIKYIIGTALDLTFLNHIDIDIQAYVQFTNDTSYWQANSFKFGFQNVTTFFKLGGNDVNIYGGGTLDGNGQVWYDLYAADIYTLRPVLIGIDGLHNSIISGLLLRYSPQYYHFVANSSNVIFDNINIAGASKSANTAKNTDGWDTYRSTDLVIQNSVVNNGDDGARIKVWPNAPSALSGDLQGGGGSGRVNNITYDTMIIDAVDYAIEVDQCYGQSNLTLCLEYPSPLTITDIVFKNFNGKTTKKYQPEIGTFACSSSAVCNNIVASNINVVSPNGTDLAYCLNVDDSALDVTCSTLYKGFN